MENSKTYIITRRVDVTQNLKELCKNNLSRRTVIISNNGGTQILISQHSADSKREAIRLASQQTVTITEQYDGDFAHIDLYAISLQGSNRVVVNEVITYRETTR